MATTISLCMIVKNEEAVLERCLHTASKLVDEIVIVDTGSTDGTRDIAARFTANIHPFVWVQDFAAARNEALKHASGEWILVLDADEYIEEAAIAELRRYLEAVDRNKQQGVELPIYNIVGGGKIVESTGLRLFLRSPDIYYIKPIHEQIYRRNGSLGYSLYPFTIYHTGYLPETVQAKNKSERNTSILERMRVERRLTPYESFTLGNEYMSQNRYAEAIEQYEFAYAGFGAEERWHIHCSNSLSKAYLNEYRIGDSLRILDECIRKWGQYTDFYFTKGLVLRKIGFHDEAIAQFETCVRMAESSGAEKFWLLSPDNGLFTPSLHLAELYYQRLDLAKTVHYLSKCLQINNRDMATLTRFIRLLLTTDSSEQVIAFLDRNYPSSNPQHASQLLMAGLLVGNRDLIIHYARHDQGERMSGAMKLRMAALTADRPLFDRTLASLPASEGQADRDRSLYLAACLWRDPAYLVDVNRQTESFNQAFHRLLEAALQSKPADCTLEDPGMAVSLLIDLFAANHFETYDWLINGLSKQARVEITKRLGDYFMVNNQIAIAMDYYSVLLSEGTMHASGYAHLAWLYAAQGEKEEAVGFLKEAIERHPTDITYYTQLLQLSKEPKEKLVYKTLLNERLPKFHNVTLIQQL